MKKKRWWPGILTGCFLTSTAIAMVRVPEVAHDVPWVLGMMPFIFALLIRRAYEKMSGQSVSDEHMRFFVRAWNTTMLTLILLFGGMFMHELERELLSLFNFERHLVYPVLAAICSGVGYVVAGTFRLLIWPRSVPLSALRHFAFGWICNTFVLYLSIFAFL